MNNWLKPDGTLNLDVLDALKANLDAVTDSNAEIDKVIKGAKIGAPVVVAFKCNHSGLYYKSDFVKQWGRIYGHGLGPDPVSEVLDSDYYTDPPKVTESTMDINSIMHPLNVTKVQVDLMTVPVDEFNANQAIVAMEDPRMFKRAAILRANQLKNPLGKLRTLQANWMILNGSMKGL